MYNVNNQPFASFMAAVTAARSAGAEVFEVREDGSQIRRWAIEFLIEQGVLDGLSNLAYNGTN